MEKKIWIKRFLMMVLGNVICGIAVSMFRYADFGIDPYNTGVTGLWKMLRLWDYGTFFMVQSFLTLVIDFFFLDRKKLGAGTIVAMFAIGYVIEFTDWVFGKFLPAPGIALRLVFLVAALLILCFASSMYYVADMGVSPYDAVPICIAEKTGLKFKLVRVTADTLWVLIGLLGKQRPGLSTIVIALCLGPLIEAFHPLNRRILNNKNEADQIIKAEPVCNE